MKKICFFIMVLATIFPLSLRATITDTDATPTEAEVQTLVTNATEGGTIRFQGDATWASQVNVTKNITIDGNGHTLTTNSAMASGFFNITGFTASSLVRITGFTFDMKNYTPAMAIYVNGMTGGLSGGNIRIDHNTFYYGGTAINFYHLKGLVDNNWFYNGVKAMDIDAGSRALADLSWTDMSAGTANAIFFEDNHVIADANFTLGGSQEQVSSENGGKLVVRYNIFDGSTNNETEGPGVFTPIMTHGNAAQGDFPGYWERSTGVRRGQSVVEIYNNTMRTKRFNQAITLRGSANIVYGNTMTYTTIIGNAIYLREEEYGASDWAADYRTAWPAEDQVHNSFFWNNTLNGLQLTAGDFVGDPTLCSAYPASCTAGLQKDRDYFLHAPCAAGDSVDVSGNVCTHGKETFLGLNGHTDGFNGASAGTTTNSSYTPYGTMSFASTGDNAYYGYAPYTYPHPLQGGEAPTTYTVTGSTATCSSITCDSPINSGSGGTCTTTPGSGKHFVSISGDTCTGTGTTTWTFSGITSNCAVTAICAADAQSSGLKDIYGVPCVGTCINSDD